MKILKYKKISKNKYKISFDNDETITLYDDVIINYNLLIKKEISEKELTNILIDNEKYLSYDLALKYIDKKMRCEKEIVEYLRKKNIDNNKIEYTINKLRNNKLLNDKLYIDSYISDKFRINKIGPNKIKKDLLKLGFSIYDIENGLSKISNDEVQNLLDILIDKKLKQNKSYGGNILRTKMISYFVNNGFYRKDVEKIINTKNLNDINIYNSEYNKLYKKYSKKYTGYELEMKIKGALFKKGLHK
mgnify:CR=1 FL=1